MLLHCSALPSQGPEIENLRKSYANQHYFLGDQIALRCLSHDSKPAAQLDWILNDRINLTEISTLSNVLALASSASNSPTNETKSRRFPAFLVQGNRHVRLAPHSLQLPPSQDQLAAVQTLLPITANNSAKAASARSALGPQRPSRISNGESYFIGQPSGLAQTSGGSQPPSRSHQQPIKLTSKSLDQLAEFSTSTLSLNVTLDLLRLLQDLNHFNSIRINDGQKSRSAPISPQNNHQEHKFEMITYEPLGLSNNNNRSVGFRQRNSSFRPNRSKVAKRYGSAAGTNVQVIFVLRIRCVARVLHLNMLDEVKLKLVNRTGAEHHQRIEEPHEQKQTMEPSANSAFAQHGKFIFTNVSYFCYFRRCPTISN